MTNYERVFTPEFKIDAALSAMHGQSTPEDVATVLSVTTTQVDSWCRQLIEADPQLLETTREAIRNVATPILSWDERRRMAS